MKKIYSIKELQIEPPGITLLGGFNSLLSSAIKHDETKQGILGDIFEEAYGLGIDYGRADMQDIIFNKGQRVGYSEGFSDGIYREMTEGAKLLYVPNVGKARSYTSKANLANDPELENPLRKMGANWEANYRHEEAFTTKIKSLESDLKAKISKLDSDPIGEAEIELEFKKNKQ